jgi:GH25 family lysozyme M1 (1,4-beta-N-acetylmuramidase)
VVAVILRSERELEQLNVRALAFDSRPFARFATEEHAELTLHGLDTTRWRTFDNFQAVFQHVLGLKTAFDETL